MMYLCGMKNMLLSLLIIFSVLSCDQEGSKEGISSKRNIVVTTNIIYDAVDFIAGEKNEVIGLMGAGVDPHLYKASQRDVSKLSNADMLVYNGLHLEGKMIDILEKMKRNTEVVALGEGISEERILRSDEFSTPDPHIWFDALLWTEAIEYFSVKLIEWDPDNAQHYKKRTEEYLSILNEVDEYAKLELSKINEKQRVLITAHDAFNYFGRAYSIEVYGLQGISTMAEFGLKDISDLVKFIIDRNIRSVFIESSVSEKSLKSVVEGCKQKGHDVEIGGVLYSDAMGERDGPEGSYKGMFLYNVNTIVKGLK